MDNSAHKPTDESLRLGTQTGVPEQCAIVRARLARNFETSVVNTEGLNIEQLSAEELSDERFAALEAHLESCPSCLKAVMAFQESWAPELDTKLLQCSSATGTPASATGRLTGLLSGSQTNRTRRRHMAIRVGIAIAASLVVVVGLQSWQPVKTRKTTQRPAPPAVTESNVVKTPPSPTEPKLEAPPVTLRAKAGFVVAQHDVSGDIPFFFVVPVEQNSVAQKGSD